MGGLLNKMKKRKVIGQKVKFREKLRRLRGRRENRSDHGGKMSKESC